MHTHRSCTDPDTQVHGHTRRYTCAETREKDKTVTPAWLTGTRKKSLRDSEGKDTSRAML